MVVLILGLGTALAGLIYWIYKIIKSQPVYRGEVVMFGGFVYLILLSLTAMPIIVGYVESYESYAKMKAFYEETVNQYRTSITMYEDKAVLDFDEESFTDFKYQGYQENISSLIKDLRREVANYNNLYTRKQVVSKNWLYGAIIVTPDEDMKLLKMKE
jgi:hypothetical protein